jgi:hypothetical protein
MYQTELMDKAEAIMDNLGPIPSPPPPPQNPPKPPKFRSDEEIMRDVSSNKALQKEFLALRKGQGKHKKKP